MADPVTWMIVGTAISTFSGLQEAKAMEEQAKAQQRIYDAQALQTRRVAERNAQIITDKSKYDAARFKEQSKAEQAAAQRDMIEQRRVQKLVESTAIARAGSSGGDVGDPTVLNIMGDIGQEGQFAVDAARYTGDSAASLLNTEAALALYEGQQSAGMTRYTGQSQADLMSYQGQVARFEGKQAARSKRMSTLSNAVSSGGSMYAKYGGSGAGGRTFGTPNQSIDAGDYLSSGARRDIGYSASGGYGPYRY